MARFSLLALFVLLTIIAVGISGLNQYGQAKRLNVQAERIRILEEFSQIQRRVSQLLLSLDPDDSKDADIHKLVARITPPESIVLRSTVSDEFAYLFCSVPEIADIDGDAGDLEMIMFHNDSYTIPGTVATVVALFDGPKFVDVVSRTGSTRFESHSASFADANGDGTIDAVIDVKPGFLRSGQPDEKVVWTATEFGLKNLDTITQ